MEYMYGNFSEKQISDYAQEMHRDVHKLLLYKDPKFEGVIFGSEKDFYNFFTKMMYRFAGMNSLLGEPVYMVALMCTLRFAYDETLSDCYSYKEFRRLILDAHGYINKMFEEV